LLNLLANYGHGPKIPMVTFCASGIFTNFCFLNHNFGSSYMKPNILKRSSRTYMWPKTEAIEQFHLNRKLMMFTEQNWKEFLFTE